MIKGLCISLLCASLVAGCATPKAVSPRAELETMFDADQRHRAALQEAAAKNAPSPPPEFPEMVKKQQAIDAANLTRLNELIAAQGWPARSVVGDRAAMSAFLIVQHSDLTTQIKYLPMLREAVAAGEARPEDLALLEDRVLVGEGKKQRYGSQLEPDGNGGWRFSAIEDEKNVDERRKSVGLPPIAEYAKQFGFEYKPQ